MTDLIAGKPMDPLMVTELELLQRRATRYSELVKQRDYLVGLMCLAVRTGDTTLKATTKQRLADTEAECNECYAALLGGTRETLQEAA